MTKHVALAFCEQLFEARNAHAAYGILRGNFSSLDENIKEGAWGYEWITEPLTLESRHDVAGIFREIADALDAKPT